MKPSRLTSKNGDAFDPHHLDAEPSGTGPTAESGEKMQMRPRSNGRSRPLSILVAAVATTALKSYAQTSGTWIPTSAPNVDWNTPSQWIGGVPDNGGVATFVENTGSAFSPSINSNYTLSKIGITSSAPYNLAGSGSITFPAAGGTLNINNGTGPINSIDTIAVPILGGPMTVTGNGAVYLSGSNTFEGGVNISGGTLQVNSDAALGATDLPADGVTLNSGTLNSTIALTTSRPIKVNGTSTIQIKGAGYLNGVISGSGSLIKGPASGGALYFNNSGNTFSGTFYDDYSYPGTASKSVYISGQGALPNLAAFYTTSYLTIDNSSATNSNRLGTNTAVYADGGFIALYGLASTLYNETAGSLNVTTGQTTLTLYNGSTGVTFSSGIYRQNSATLVLRGTNLSDATPSAGTQSTFVFAATAPAGLTGGGALATPNASIIPWILGIQGQTSSSGGNIAQFCTYNSSNGGIRPLLASEYASSFGVATNNVRLSYMSPTLAVPSGGVTCNSLTVTSNSSAGVTVGGTGTITDTSGGIMINNFISNSVTAEIDAPIAFPSGVEGVIQNNPGLITTNVISGNSGVTKSLGGIWTISGNGNNSTYSGPTTINNGTISISSNLPVNQNSALGNTSAPITLAGGDYNSDTLQFTASGLVIDRAINFTNTPSGLSEAGVIANSLGTQQVTFNGPFSANTINVLFEFGLPAAFVPGTPAANATVNGVISGTATVNDSTLNNFNYLQISSEIFNAANTYSGGTILQNGLIYAGNNSAFGTGTITTLAATTSLRVGGVHASLPTIGAAAGTIGTDTSRSVGNSIVLGGYGLNLNNAIPLTLTGPIQLSSSTEGAGVPTILIDFGAPSIISGTISDGSVGNTGLEIAGNITLSGINKFTGGVTLPSAGTGANSTSPDGTATSAGYATFASPGAFPAYGQLTINAGATAVAANHGSGTFNTLLISSLTLDPAGLMDLTNNSMVVRTGSSLATITSAVAQGFNGGTWQTSAGITSSAAAADFKHLTALGVIVNDNGSGSPLYGSGGTIASTFGGSTTPLDGDILVKYTYYGDANLDGKVDASDYSRIDAAFATNSSASPLTGWYNGDFNYDGIVNGSDYTLIDNAFNTQGASLAAAIVSPLATTTAEIAGTSAVPEPTMISLLAFGAAGLIGRRRRR